MKNIYPKKIIIYREGDVQIDLNVEAEKLKLRLVNFIYNDYNSFEFIFISITILNDYCFNIISQDCKSAINPTRYKIIENTSTMTVDELQKFTFKIILNFDGTKYVPAPCEHANKFVNFISSIFH